MGSVNIEQEFGTIARGMAYPFGQYDDRVIEVLKNCGIEYARTVYSTESFNMPTNWMMWHPTCHHNNAKLMQLEKQFIEAPSWDLCKLFYLWGHSYEFDNDNNWNVMEEFSEYIGGRENVWYTTNIEIYDYVKAYEGLRVSYDKHIIYNPASIDVWVFLGGEIIKIEAGQTIHIK